MLIIGNVCFAPHNLIQPTGSRRYVTTACLPLNQHDVASTVTNYAKRSLTQRCPERLFTPASRQRSDLAAIPPVTLRGQTDGRMRCLAQQAIHGHITLRYVSLNSVKPITTLRIPSKTAQKRSLTQTSPERLFTQASIPENTVYTWHRFRHRDIQRLHDLTRRDGRQNETFGTTGNIRTYLSADSTTGVSAAIITALLCRSSIRQD